MEKYNKVNIMGVYRVSIGNEDLYAVVISCHEWKDLLLPIFIGRFEAIAIQTALEKIKMKRPMTHDLIANILDTIGLAVERVTIDAMVDDLFTATIVLKDEKGKKWYIDARPSDSIAIALRTNSPIYVADRLKEYAVPSDNLGI